MRTSHPPAGIVLPELLAAAAVLAILVAALIVAAAEGRRQASIGDSLANLKQIGEGTSHYGADYAERMWGFSWLAGVQYAPWAPPAASDRNAQANQAADIIRRRGVDPGFTPPTGWIPHPLFSHLALADYLDLKLPSDLLTSPEDATLRRWQTDPSSIPGGNARWRYYSSYELPLAFWAPDARQLDPPVSTFAQSGTQNIFAFGLSVPFRGRNLTDVRYPAHKALMYDRYQRHFGPRIAYYAYPEARVPVATVDGSAQVRRTADANQGFRPNDPLSPLPSMYRYVPAAHEPPTLSGAAEDNIVGYYRWTRSGLRGRDFGGPEIPWVD